MRSVVEALRRAQRQAIAENPVEITITRIEKVERGGAFEEKKSTVGPFLVRLFNRNSNVLVKEISTLAGMKQVDTRWGMLADWQAEFRVGSNVLDTFVAFDTTFIITAIYPQTAYGQIVGYQADIEAVN